MFAVIFILSIVHWSFLCEGQPIHNPTTVYSSPDSSGSTCPSQDTINEEHKRVRESILDYYNRPCSCEGPGWTRVAYLDMSDTNQQCPSNWNLTTSPVRGCGRSSTGWKTCDSVIYPVNGRTYSSVCGKIIAYQKGIATAFYTQYNDIESVYVSGVSITHGVPGSRQHIWTFAAALEYNCTTGSNNNHLCPCTNIHFNWPYQVPSFIGNDYFCESGKHSQGNRCYDGSIEHYPDDPLWDGQGCPASSTCCGLNSPPWFCKNLPQATRDDLEIRLCAVNTLQYEDTLVSLMDIYIK